jgi:hypothetical protein
MMMEEAACGKPPRNRKLDFFLSLAITIPAFLMILVRVYSRMVVANKLETDDVAMVVCGVGVPRLHDLAVHLRLNIDTDNGVSCLRSHTPPSKPSSRCVSRPKPSACLIPSFTLLTELQRERPLLVSWKARHLPRFQLPLF